MNVSLQDPMFIYAIAFVVFLALAYKFGAKPILAWIDAEIFKIRTELDTARALRFEAEAALADCKQKQIRAEADANEIVNTAKDQVEVMRKQAELELTNALARHEQLAAERIRTAEAQAIADVRYAAIDLAMAVARKTLSENLNESDATRLVDQAIADVPGLKAEAKSKAKAA